MYGSSTQSLGFTYDQYGNRWTQSASPSGGNPSFNFNTKNQITSASGVVYDADGNLTNDGNGNTFSYDPEGKLTSSVVGGVSSTYKNDPLGHRAESVTSAGTFDYVYDPSGRLITEADTTCNSGAPYYPCTDFVYIGASSIPFSQFSDWACCAAYATFNYYDYAGSLRETTSYAGLSAPYQNDPFGDGSSQPTWFGFAQLLTMGSGLQLSSTRGYHQGEARWLTPDPSGMGAVNVTNPQSWNQYSYVLNNPLSYIDPAGLDCIHINVDTGVFEGFDSGDCDNSTEELANSGVYVDGTVNTIYTTTGDSQGVVTGYSGTNADTGALLTGTFGSPSSDSGNLAPINNSSWGWNFTKSFVTGFSLKAVYQSFVDPDGCDRLMATTFAEDFNPLGDSPGVGDAADLAPKAAAQAGRTAASAYSIYQGLSVPLRSSIYRGLQSSTLGYAQALGDAAPYLQVGGAGAHALATASMAAYNGECH